MHRNRARTVRSSCSAVFRPCPNNTGPTAETACHQFTPEQRRVVASTGPAFFEIAMMRCEDAGSWRLAPGGSATGSKPSSDGLPLRADHRGNARDGGTRRPKLSGLLIPGVPAALDVLAPLLAGGQGRHAGIRRRRRRSRIGFRLDRLSSELPGGPPDLTVTAIDDGTHGVAEIAQEVPPVGHLNRIGSALPDPVGIGAGAVPGDDFDAGTLPKPIRERLRLAVAEQIEHHVAFEVDKNGAVSVPSRHAQSSTPSTRVSGRGASIATGLASMRSTVSGLVGMARRTDSLATASPPSARPTWR